MTPAECGYESTVSISGGPEYAQLNHADQTVILDAPDSAKTQNYEVYVSSTIEFFNDYTMTEKESITQKFSFFLLVGNPNDIDCETEAQIADFTISDMQVFVSGQGASQTLPVLTETSEGKCGDLVFEIANLDQYSSFLN